MFSFPFLHKLHPMDLKRQALCIPSYRLNPAPTPGIRMKQTTKRVQKENGYTGRKTTSASTENYHYLSFSYHYLKKNYPYFSCVHATWRSSGGLPPPLQSTGNAQEPPSVGAGAARPKTAECNL